MAKSWSQNLFPPLFSPLSPPLLFSNAILILPVPLHLLQKRTSMDPSALEGATPVKKPARKVTSARPSTSTDHAVIGINALKNLASLVTSSCKQCRGPWLHISHEFYSTELCLLTFTCHDQHVAKWSSEINELVPLEPSEIPHEFSQPH